MANSFYGDLVLLLNAIKISELQHKQDMIFMLCKRLTCLKICHWLTYEADLGVVNVCLLGFQKFDI